MGSLLVAPKGRRIQARLKPMRIHCDGAALARAAIELGLAHLPSLRLEGGLERLKLEAFDTDLWIHADLPAEVEEPGAVLLPAAMFSAVGSHLGHGITTLSCDGQRLVVQAGDVRVELPAFRDEPRPTIPIPSVEFHQMRLWGSSLAKACRVLFAVDNSHPVLEGIPATCRLRPQIGLRPEVAKIMVDPTGVPPLTTTAGGATAPPVVFVGIHRGTQQFALRAADAVAIAATRSSAVDRTADGSFSREATGCELLDCGSYGDPVSNAEAMAFRRAAAKFGLGRSLYDKTTRSASARPVQGYPSPTRS